MSLLTELDAAPAPHAERTAPHRYRLLAGRVLAVSEPGHWMFLTREEYEAYLRGADESHPRFEELREKGFLGHAMDFDRLAEDAMEGSLLSWQGTRRFVLLLERGRSVMAPERARDAVDLAFSVPGPAVVLELAAADPARAWKTARFAARYAARRSEWNGRRSRVWLRTAVPPEAYGPVEAAADGLGLIVELDAAGPRRLPAAARRWSAAAEAAGAPAARGLLRWRPGAKDPAGWAAALRAAGVGSVRLSPDDVAKASEVPEFAAFYAAFLDAALDGGAPLREEWAAAALRRHPPAEGRPREERGSMPEDLDAAGTLCVAPWGELLAAERVLDLPESERALWSLGAVGTTAWEELPAKDSLRTLLASAEPDHQPLCGLCVYKTACRPAPSRRLAVSGQFWGRLASSPACRAPMAALDAVFTRLAEEGPRDGLLGWSDSWTLL